MAKQPSAGLLVFTKVNDKLIAVLQVRGRWNVEENRPESWPGLCQVTAHGKLEPVDFDSFSKGMEREACAEIGYEAYEHASRTGVFEVLRKEVAHSPTRTYGALVPDGRAFLKKIRLSASTGGLMLVEKNQLNDIQDAGKFSKIYGVDHRSTIAMFEDEHAALQTGFELFQK